MPAKLLKVGFRNYRSIGDEPVILDLEKRVNVLIGPNNAGKSSVIEAVGRLSAKKFKFGEMKEEEHHQRNKDTKFGMYVEGTWAEKEERRGSVETSGVFEFTVSWCEQN